MYLGEFPIDRLITFAVTTHTASTGAVTDADSVPTYRVYEDETTTPLLTGSMAKLDDANTTGFYSEQITLSAANGFENGKSYNIYITATVATIAAAAVYTFQVEAAKPTATQIADNVLRRQMDNTEASSDGDALDLSSLYGLVQMAQEAAISGGTLTVKKTDGTTTLGTKTVTADANASPITGVS